MKRFVVMLIAALCAHAGAATWNAFTADADSLEEEVTFFDADSVVRSGDAVAVQFESRRDAEKDPDDTRYRQAWRFTFHCSARTFERTAVEAFAWDGRKFAALGPAVRPIPVPRGGYEERWFSAACAPTFPTAQAGGPFVRVPGNDRAAWAVHYFERARPAFWARDYGPPSQPPPARLDCSDSRFRFSNTLRDLPPEVLQLLMRQGTVSDHGGPFNGTDVIRDNTPQRRLAAAAIADRRVIVHVEHGGIGYNVEVWAFERKDVHWTGRQLWHGSGIPSALPAVLAPACRPPATGQPSSARIGCSLDADRSITLSYSDPETSFSYKLDRRAVARGIARRGRIVDGMMGDREPSPEQVAAIRERLVGNRDAPGNECPAYALDEFMRGLDGHDEPAAATGGLAPAEVSRAVAAQAQTQALFEHAKAALAHAAAGPQRSAALHDLAVVDTQLPPDADLRKAMAMLYATLDMPRQELSQWNLWISVHEPGAAQYDGRCWARVRLHVELPQAIADCTRAAELDPRAPGPLEHRGWARLRLGLPADPEPEQALADFDGAMQSGGRVDWARYGRGLANQMLGHTVQARIDMGVARRLTPDIDRQVAKAKLSPTPGP